MDPGEVLALGIVFGTISGTILTLARWRMTARNQPQGLSAGVEDRLDRIEQAVDAIAVEVERISESQRFTSRLIAERLPAHDALPGVERGRT